MRKVNSAFIIPAAVAGLFALSACSQKPAHDDANNDTRTESRTTTSTTSGTRTTTQANMAPRDTVLRDTTRILGTPGSPTGAESRGMPGEKPIPGTKK